MLVKRKWTVVIGFTWLLVQLKIPIFPYHLNLKGNQALEDLHE